MIRVGSEHCQRLLIGRSEEVTLRNANVGGCDDDDDAILLQLNDPDLRFFVIGTEEGEFLPRAGEWETVGDCIGSHNHVPCLCFNALDGVEKEDVAALCKGLSRNRSITELQIGKCDFGGELYIMLIPFFEQNHNFEFLRIASQRDVDLGHMLSAALLSFNHMKKFEIDDARVDTAAERDIMEALAKHTGLIDVRVDGADVGYDGCIGLTRLLQHPDSVVSGLSLQQNHIDDKAAALLAVSMAGNSSLKHLNLGNNRFECMGATAISIMLKNPLCRLESLDFEGNSFESRGLQELARSLSSIITLKALDLSRNTAVHGSGWRVLFTELQGCPCLEKLALQETSISDSDMPAMTEFLSGNNTLKTLDLAYSEIVSALGLSYLPAVLQNPDSALEKLDLRGTYVDNGVVAAFADSLRGNKRLKELMVENCGISGDAFRALARALCDDSSITDTYNSNHTLERISVYRHHVPLEKLKKYLSLNSNREKGDVARQKVIEVHFASDVQKLVELDLALLPHAFAWVAKAYTERPKAYKCSSRVHEVGQSSLLYRLVRTMPTLYDFDGRCK